MIPIQDKISNYFTSISPTEKRNLELILGLPYYNNYLRTLKAQFELNEIEINKPNLKTILVEQAIQNVYITELYNDSIFFKSEKSSLGIILPANKTLINFFFYFYLKLECMQNF